MEADTIENIWHHTKCIDLLKGQNIIEIDSECSVGEGCEVINYLETKMERNINHVVLCFLFY